MWAYESVFYQIYPLGFCGAPFENDGKQESRILKVIDWIQHIEKLGANAIYFSPVFESDTHGYNTRDYTKIDCRLGTNADFKEVCEELHKVGIKVVLDGVFNHVGRGFWAFQDVLANREGSRYRDWFHIDFGGNSNYNDGLWYEGWEGNYDLVKLNLRNEEVIQHIFAAVKGWIDEFDIDGLRLDVAYCLDHDFLRRLRQHVDGLKEDFFIVGETLHGDYNQWMNDAMCNSVTNYECYKGLFSSFNSMNMFEIAHSLHRQFGSDQWCIYRGKHLMTFVDNHDVTRLASILTNKKHIPLAYGLLMGMPGIPCLYYGSEWAEPGEKAPDNDYALRPCFEEPKPNELTEFIKKLIRVRQESDALCNGAYKNVVIQNHQLVFERCSEKERVIVAINAADYPYTANAGELNGTAADLLTGETVTMNGQLELKPYSVQYLKFQYEKCTGRFSGKVHLINENK